MIVIMNDNDDDKGFDDDGDDDCGDGGDQW